MPTPADRLRYIADDQMPGAYREACTAGALALEREVKRVVESAEWMDAVAAIAGHPGPPTAEAIERLIKAGDALR